MTVYDQSLRDRRKAAVVPGDFILHPAALVALAVLGLNDHYLKHAQPGWLTGKLSDLAGMIFFPLLLLGLWEWSRTLTRQPIERHPVALSLAVGVTAAVFSAINLHTFSGDLFRELLTHLYRPFGRTASHVVDHTDLLALVALVVPISVYLQSRCASFPVPLTSQMQKGASRI